MTSSVAGFAFNMFAFGPICKLISAVSRGPTSNFLMSLLRFQVEGNPFSLFPPRSVKSINFSRCLCAEVVIFYSFSPSY